MKTKGQLQRRVATFCVTAIAMISLLSGRMMSAQDEQEPGAGLAGGQMVRGIVTSATGDRLAIKTDQGEAYQVTVTSNTRIMKEGQPVRMPEIKPGDSVGAMGLLDAPTRTVHALFIMVMDAEQVKKAREDLGKVFIAGKVAAMDDLKLTILRPDGVTQVIAVDEGTSFRKGGRRLQSIVNGSGPAGAAGRASADTGGESITLADIKVGDTVAGRGGLKSGVFVPTELAVMDPAARQRRRRVEGGAAAAPAAPQAPPQ